ncbi:MAG: DNA packaging protein, partial [Clostridiales bacterium]|nr:DNA packaging protein [Clostridiales bacterium]
MARQPMDTQDKLKIINADPALWLKNFVKITDAEGKIIPFVLNSEQGDFLSHKGRYNIILKSRQLGMTTVMLGLMLWSAHLKSKSNYMMLSYDTDSVQNIFNRLKQMYESIPDKYRIPEKRNNKMELLLENGSRIAVKVCGYKTVGRSFTNEIIHCSEFAFWSEQQQEKGLLALEQSLNKSDEAFICIESTANGIGNNFYKIFNAAIKGHSKYKAFFYNWYKGSGAKSQFKNEVHIAVKWHSKGIAGKLHEIDLDPYQRKLFDDGCTLRQLMWREYKLQDISEEEFQQEFPSFPDEAFITTNTGVFDALTITQRFKY